MGAHWIDIVQTIASVAGVIVTIIGFGLVMFQIRQVERAQHGETNVALYAHMQNVRAIFQDHPELRPYFYENKAMDQSDPLYNLAIGMAESITDLFELVTFLKSNIQADSWDTWKKYFHDIYHSSPVLRSFLEQNGSWYTEGLLGIILDNTTERHGQK